MEELGIHAEVARGTGRLRLDGPLGAYESHALRTAIGDLGDEGITDVTVDARGVTFLDSAGLNALLEAAEALERGGGRLVLDEPSPAVMQVLELTHLRERFDPPG